MRRAERFALVGLGALLAASAWAAGAQQPAQRPAQALENVDLVYEREVYIYPGQGRRDPFLTLTSQEGLGPRFEEISLRGIIYSTGRGRSVALLSDAEGKIYRVRSGDVIGNARVVEIGPLRVVFAVDEFGVIRQEMLELKRGQGANG